MRAFKLPAWFRRTILRAQTALLRITGVWHVRLQCIAQAHDRLPSRAAGTHQAPSHHHRRRSRVATRPAALLITHTAHDLHVGGELRARRERRREELNTGFMAIRPTNATRSFWARMLATCASWAYADDQFCLNALLLGPNRSATIRMPRDGEKWWTNNAANVTKASCTWRRVSARRDRAPFVFLPTDHFPVTTASGGGIGQHRQHKAFLFHAACELGLRNKVEALRKESLIFLPALLQEAVAHADCLCHWPTPWLAEPISSMVAIAQQKRCSRDSAGQPVFVNVACSDSSRMGTKNTRKYINDGNTTR